ncbi:hypothetical protein SBC1_14500 [Caballeronia sp. SBC1]|uniref:hypothetical protein n=1 Tax=unclassified Caballeronia TaxID=2646786 RepID=UPI0013E18EFD|nr:MULTISPECIES: hypothetical protein [unclassified Caballeronia]QIE23563.1 hypothetical protein SBC2_15890 [Caballeronia sp. SBC2]QIN61458.1 hypothetical protein SBC1_14500 [Caballeronia sp. SBC1]
MAKRSVLISRIAPLQDTARFRAIASAAVASGKLSAADALAADAALSQVRDNRINTVDAGLCMRLRDAAGAK